MASGKTFGKVRGQAAIFSWHEDTDHTFTLNSILRKKEEEKKTKHTQQKALKVYSILLVVPGRALHAALRVSFQCKLIKVSLCDGPAIPSRL